MSIEAKVICDSISPEGIRLTTMQLKYPRIIHSEFMTHRVFGRNASSSRAIPIQTQIKLLDIAHLFDRLFVNLLLIKGTQRAVAPFSLPPLIHAVPAISKWAQR